MSGCRRSVVAVASFSVEAADRIDAVARLLLGLDSALRLALVLPFKAALLSDVPKVGVGIVLLEQDHITVVVFHLVFSKAELVLRVCIWGGIV